MNNMALSGTLFPCILLLAAVFIPVPRSLGSTRADAPAVSLVTDAAPGAPASHGMEKLLAALRQKGIAFEKTASLDGAKGRTLLVVGLANGKGAAARLLRTGKQPPPRGS